MQRLNGRKRRLVLTSVEKPGCAMQAARRNACGTAGVVAPRNIRRGFALTEPLGTTPVPYVALPAFSLYNSLQHLLQPRRVYSHNTDIVAKTMKWYLRSPSD
jgi:hypothetical protein